MDVIMKKQIICDMILFKPLPGSLKESAGQGGPMYVEGIMQRAGSENQNGRVYPKEILEREAKKYMETFVKENRAYGELDHPDSNVVEVKNSSHTVENLWWKGDDLYGRLEILNGVTPAGTIVANILRRGKTLGISSRGLGSTKQIGESTVQVENDFELLCWDFVTNPSTQKAFMGIAEGVNPGATLNGKYLTIDNIVRDIFTDTADIYNIKG